MRGDLSETTAADVCRRLAASSASGLLSIEGPDGQGSVAFVAGRIVAASSPAPRARLGDRLVGAGYLDPAALEETLAVQERSRAGDKLGVLLVAGGYVSRDAVRRFVQEQVLDALLELVRWPAGSFEFVPGSAPPDTDLPLDVPVDEVLVEVSRRQQQWAELTSVIPDLESVPRFRHGVSSASAALTPDEFTVLATIDGERSIRTIASDLGYSEFDAARIVYGLTLLEILQVRQGSDEIADDVDAAPDPSEDAGEDDVGMIIEADLDERTLRTMLAEMTGARPAAGTRSPAEADDTPAEMSNDTADDDASAHDELPADDVGTSADEPDRSTAPRGERNDVGEFLRELSSLSDEHDGPPKRRGQSSADDDAPTRPGTVLGPTRRSPGDQKRKKRGLFGRGS